MAPPRLMVLIGQHLARALFFRHRLAGMYINQSLSFLLFQLFLSGTHLYFHKEKSMHEEEDADECSHYRNHRAI